MTHCEVGHAVLQYSEVVYVELTFFWSPVTSRSEDEYVSKVRQRCRVYGRRIEYVRRSFAELISVGFRVKEHVVG